MFMNSGRSTSCRSCCTPPDYQVRLRCAVQLVERHGPEEAQELLMRLARAPAVTSAGAAPAWMDSSETTKLLPAPAAAPQVVSVAAAP